MDKYKPPNNYLPEAYTCFFLLKMPKYTSKSVLKDKLSYAIHVCKSIDIDEVSQTEYDHNEVCLSQHDLCRIMDNPVEDYMDEDED